MSTQERLYKIIARELKVKSEKIQLHSNFVEDLGADSLDIVELVMAIENEFSLSIQDDEADNINTVRAALDYIQTHEK